MATTTQNLGLIKPAGTDKIRIAQINSNMDTLDAKIGPVGNTSLQTQVTNAATQIAKLENEIGVVVTGNKTASGVTASVGQYVILKNSSITGKTDGLYTAAKAIPANTAIDSTYLAAVTGGGLNSLDSAINSVEAKSLGNFLDSRSVSNPDFNNLTAPGVWFIGNMDTATNSPGAIGWVTMLVLAYGSTIVQVIFGGRQIAEAKTRIWVRYRYQNEWKPWYYTQMQAV